MREELDLKYRPRRFADVLGNVGPRKLLLRRSVDGTLAGRSKMFGGPKGCGKTTLARITAMALACKSLREGEPCGECEFCESILTNSHPNVQEFDAASEGTVDKVRNMVREADYGTLGDGKCVYILDEAQRLTAQAQDALLKPVESRDFLVMLCTTEPDKIKVPIRSRVEEYAVSAPEEGELVAWLAGICAKEGFQAEESALRLIARNRDRCPRLCVLALDTVAVEGPITDKAVRQFLGFDDFETLTRALATLDQDPMRAFALLDELAARRAPTWIRDTTVWAITSAMRADVGAKGTFPVPTGRFFETRLDGWVPLARELGRIDRPSMADIEATLLQSFSRPSRPAPRPEPTPASPAPESLRRLSESEAAEVPPVSPEAVDAALRAGARERDAINGVPQAAPPAPLPPPPPAPAAPKAPPPPAAAPKAPEAAPKAMEVDGIRFTADERLTTLDDKIEKGTVGPAGSQSAGPDMPVEFDRANVPIPEQEFVRSLLSGRSSA